MSFLRKKNQKTQIENKKTPFYKRRGWKIFFTSFGLFLILVISYSAYIVASGSKVFQNGLGGGTALIKTLYGNKATLRGEQEGRINVLLTGMGGTNHPGGMLTDTIMIMSIRVSDNKLALLSVPRDLSVPIPGYSTSKINSAFATGYNNYVAKNCGKKAKQSCLDAALIAGENLTKETLSQSLDLPVHYYVNANFSSFEKIIDQLGGIDVYVAKAINDPYFPDESMKGYQPFKIKAGQQHLDGKTALKYARSRHTTSDFDRASRQQNIIFAIKEKAMQSGILTNPKKIADLATTLGESIKTDFTPAELKAFMDMIKDANSSSIINEVLKSGPDGLLVDGNDGSYFLKPKTGNFKEIQRFVSNIFDLQKKETAKIEVLNASKTAGLAGDVAKLLKEDGYTITNIGTSKDKLSRTVINDYSDGSFPQTVQFIQKNYGGAVQKKSRELGVTSDIQIIIGDDYKSTN